MSWKGESEPNFKCCLGRKFELVQKHNSELWTQLTESRWHSSAVFSRGCLGKMSENPPSNIAWEDRLTWFKSSPEYRALDKMDGEPLEFEWNIFPGCTTLQLCNKVQEFLSTMSKQPQEFTGRIIFMSMFNDISWRSKDN